MTDEPHQKFQAVGCPSDQSWPPAPHGQLPPDKPPSSWWADLFAVPEGAATSQDVVVWWEARRLTFNKLVLGLGIPSFLLYLFFLSTSGLLPPGEDAVEPMALLFAPVMVPVAVNVC